MGKLKKAGRFVAKQVMAFVVIREIYMRLTGQRTKNEDSAGE